MRIWDISPGYLNDRSLLGEHRELHGIVSIIRHGKKGYSRHPETLRWTEYLPVLSIRHRQLSHEMKLRGFRDKSPVTVTSLNLSWPAVFIDNPGEQYDILKKKYECKEHGRIRLPRNIQELWSHHKYSMLARDQTQYREIGRQVAQNSIGFDELADILALMLRSRPDEGGIRNAVQHMWGYVSDVDRVESAEMDCWNSARLLQETTRRAIDMKESYLLASTALGELSVWMLSVLSVKKERT